MKNLYERIIAERQSHPKLALATITCTVGSTPQKAGSSAIFGPEGLIAGTVGGGVLEGEVQRIAQAAIQSKQSGYYSFNLQNDISHEQEAICGGRVSVLMDASPFAHMAVFELVKQSLLERIPGVLLTQVSMSGETLVSINRSWSTRIGTSVISSGYAAAIEPELRQLLDHAKPGDYKELVIAGVGKKTLYLLEPVFPPPHLVIAGAGHIGKALVHLGKLLDFSVTVIDERVEHANPANIPEADRFLVDDIGHAMQSIEKLSDTYIVIVTRGHTHDADALRPCIGSGAAYTGMIGSTSKLALMRKKFISEGWASAEQWDAVHAPIGIDIGSKTVQEIAISIAAELVQVRNSKK